MEDTFLTSNGPGGTLQGIRAKKHQDKSKVDTINGYCTVAGGFIFMLFSGSVYITGNISPYVASYFHLADTTKAANLLPAIQTMNVFLLPLGTTMV